MTTVRPAAVAGMFYPAQPKALSENVLSYLAQAKAGNADRPKVLVAPHAGYVYSGAIAASAYATLLPWRHIIHRVILLGPAHRMAFHGLALPHAHAFSTPLGAITLDHTAADSLRDFPWVISDNRPHALEHSLEVQLPFLQTVLDDFSLLPLVVGNAKPEEVAAVINRLWGGPETLIVISSDLSHYLPYTTANALDRRTCDAILAFSTHINPEHACGALPLNGMLLAARQHGLEAELLDLRNSGDTAGDKARVVGYGALAFYEPPLSGDSHA